MDPLDDTGGSAPHSPAAVAPTALAAPEDLRTRIGTLTLRDEARLRRRLEEAEHGPRQSRNRRGRGGRGRPRGAAGAGDASAQLARLAADVEKAEARLAARQAAVPEVSYPPQLPVSQRREDLLEAIREHQVVVVAGETGSGKTTQLPKICLELGRGVRGLIGHTQPRRIAARAVAERIAEELETPLGEAVGWKVRFTDQVGERTLVKLMTDGILLAEIQNDPLLLQYDTLIVDEAHERSLNIDFLLGYLKRLLPRRPDLKLVITSATIDPQRFSKHFGDAPVVEVSGRTYPVEVRYRPVVDPDDPEADPDRDQVQAVCDAVAELALEPRGDVLVFLSGEREIRDTADALNRVDLRDTEVLPLYGRLSAAEQHRVFTSHQSGRRVVLATNVAETSLTVPGIRYVVDPGTARISRYSSRLKVQRLPIEPISQASANQRKGRCGRLSDGVCVRLYSEEDFESRPEFTDPEILRTNLASVILQMAALGLGEVADFPFLDPPDSRQVRDGVQLLEELGALDPGAKDSRKRLTPLGRMLAQLPIDPRLARMVVEADKAGALREVLVIAAALSIQDPRERPAEHQQAADDKHRRFSDKESDFLTYVNLWDYLREHQRELSSSQFRKLCRNEFLNYLRVREWQDLHAQLRQVVKGLGFAAGSGEAHRDAVHQALLAGLLSHVGLWDVEKRDYLGARGARFAPWPGSALFRKPPRFVMAAELVETSRLWGRTLAKVEPEWVERLAEHLVKRTYSEPHWEKDRAAVMAVEKVMLYGVPLVAGRKVTYSKVDPELCRELFIRHALVEGDWSTHHTFFHENRAMLEDVEELEHRARRRDILVDDETLFDFYDQRIPADVVSGRHFDRWWKQARREQPDLLTFTPDLLVRDDADDVSEQDYPSAWTQGDLTLPLTYQFEPGADADGVTAHVPVSVLNRLSPAGFDWQVPGLRGELVTALLRSLPKALRVSFVPAPDTARAALEQLPGEPDGPLVDALGTVLRRMTGVVVPPDAWDVAKVPDHLRITFRVEDAKGKKLAEGKDLEALAGQLGRRVRSEIAQAASGVERSGMTSWDLDALPRSFTGRRDGHRVEGFPALVDEGSSVAVRVLRTAAEQRRAMRAGTRRLLLLDLPSPLKGVVGLLTNAEKLALGHNPYGGVPALLEDCVAAAVDDLMERAGGPVWDPAGYTALRDAVRADLPETTYEVVRTVAQVLAAEHEARGRTSGSFAAAAIPSVTDVRAHLDRLVGLGFVSATGRERLADLLRYLRAVGRRLDVLAQAPGRDRELVDRAQAMEAEYTDAVAELPPERRDDADVRAVRWMLEEFRVSLFAQALGTAYPVSEKRIVKALDALFS